MLEEYTVLKNLRVEKLKTVSLKFVNNKTVNVDVPDYLYDVLVVALNKAIREKRIHNNVFESNTCYLCAVNQLHLTPEQLGWVKRNLCSKCDHKIPFYLQRITQICSFNYCDIAWYINNVLDIPTVPNEYMIEGSFVHMLDELLSEHFSDRKTIKKYKALFPDRKRMYEEVFKDIGFLFAKAKNNLLEEKDNVREELINKVADDMFNGILKDIAEVSTIRLYYDILNEGDYHKVANRKWSELKLLGYYINHGVKLLLVGHIDKLYKLGNNNFVIRDRKGTHVVRYYATRNGAFYDVPIQLGGYKYLLEQNYNADVNVIGEVELTFYFDVIPTFCDTKGFIDSCDRLTSFISNQQSPIGRPRGSLCSVKYCPYYSLCKEKFTKRRM